MSLAIAYSTLHANHNNAKISPAEAISSACSMRGRNFNIFVLDPAFQGPFFT